MPCGREHSERRERRDSNWKGVPEKNLVQRRTQSEQRKRFAGTWPRRGAISVYELRLVNTLDPRRRMLGLAVLAVDHESCH